MSVSKSTCEIYDVVADGEHASIAVRAWRRPDQDRPVYGGQIIIGSTHGEYSYTWSLTSVPFKQFLVNLKVDTFLLKTLASKHRVFCHETTKLKFVGHVGTQVQAGTITQEQADVILESFEDELVDLSADQFGFAAAVEALEENSDVVKAIPSAAQRNLVFSTAVLLQGWKPNPRGMSFWNELWLEFRDALQAEIAPVEEVEHAH